MAGPLLAVVGGVVGRGATVDVVTRGATVLATAWVVVGAGAVVVVGSRVVEGAVGTEPTDFGSPLPHALSASRPATAMVEPL